MNNQNLPARVALIVLLGSAAVGCNTGGAASTTAAVTTASPVAAAGDPAAQPTQNPEDAMPRVRVEEAKEAVNSGKGVIIDVRGTDAYKAAHIKDAIDIQLPDLEKGDFKNIPKGKRIIAYCTWPNEHTSARAALLLQKAGYENAGALLGGMSAWEAAGGVVDRAPAAPEAKPAEPAKKKN